MHVNFPFVYSTIYKNKRGGTSQRKHIGSLPFEVKETSETEVEVLMSWSFGSGPEFAIPASAIRWNGCDYVSLSHVDPRSCVVKTDLPVGETHERGDAYRFTNLYHGVGALENESHLLHAYLSGHNGELDRDEALSTTFSTRNDVEDKVRTMAENLLIVGDVVFQRVVAINVVVSRTHSRLRPYMAVVNFTKYGFDQNAIDHGVFDFAPLILRAGCMTFPIGKFEAIKHLIEVDYEQLFRDLTVVAPQAFPHDSERELLSETVRTSLLITAASIGSASSDMVAAWTDLKDMTGRIDAGEAIPGDEMIEKIERLASASDEKRLKVLASNSVAKVQFYRRLGL